MIWFSSSIRSLSLISSNFSFSTHNTVPIPSGLENVQLHGIKKTYPKVRKNGDTQSIGTPNVLGHPNKSCQKTTQLAGKDWSDKKTIFKYLRLNAELKLKHSCKWQRMTWLWGLKNVKLRYGVYAIETSSLRLVWTKYESYILHAESLRFVWTKYESYILHTSAVMYNFQNLNSAVNDKVWPDLELGRRSNWGRGVYYWKGLP